MTHFVNNFCTIIIQWKLFFSHPNAKELIVIKFCIWQASTINGNGITIKQIFNISIEIEIKLLVKWLPVILQCLWLLTKQHSNVGLQLTASQEMAMDSWDWGHCYHSLQQLRQESQQKYSQLVIVYSERWHHTSTTSRLKITQYNIHHTYINLYIHIWLHEFRETAPNLVNKQSNFVTIWIFIFILSIVINMVRSMVTKDLFLNFLVHFIEFSNSISDKNSWILIYHDVLKFRWFNGWLEGRCI